MNSINFECKKEFDALHVSAMESTDSNKVLEIFGKMTEMAEKINQSPKNPVQLFNPFENKKEISEYVENKLKEIQGYAEILHPSLSTHQKSIQPVSYSHAAFDIAVGFGNMGANCWANALLSMVFFVPQFRHIYETIADHHANLNENAPTKKHGIALQNALKEYDIGLIQRKSVPAEVTQNVRLVFNHFSGFSKKAGDQEDAYEALQSLMGEYQEIQNEKEIPFCSLYSEVEEIRHYQSTGRILTDPFRKYTTLNNNCSSVLSKGYEILIGLQNKNHLSFEDLLKDFFCSTNVESYESAPYQLENGNVESCKVIQATRQFIKAPAEFSLTLMRFGNDEKGSFKITRPLDINREITLPEMATGENRPISYELDSFIVHSGQTNNSGHYLCYKKIENQWIEANDAIVRNVSTMEIDQILHGEKGTHFTSYIHHYSQKTQGNQAIATPTLFLPQQKITEKKFDTSLVASALSGIEKNETLSSLLGSISVEARKTFEHAIWLIDKTPHIDGYGTNTLKSNPSRLEQITLPWLIGTQRSSLWDQMMQVQRRKSSIISAEINENIIQSFVSKGGNFDHAFQNLPQQIKWDLETQVYKIDKQRFGEMHVHDPKYNNKYGEVVLSQGNAKEILIDSGIAAALEIHYQNEVKKERGNFEKEQLQAFNELLLYKGLTNKQLVEAFKRFELSSELRGKIYEEIWIQSGRPDIYNFGENAFQNNPRSARESIAKIISFLF